MLSQKTFLSGMTALKKGYLDFTFDTKDEIQVKVWYAALKGLSDEQFKTIIADYYAHNQHPPKCARDLTVVLVDKVVSNAKIKPETALNYVRDIVSNCGGWQYEGRDEIYSNLKKHPALLETVKEFEGELRTMRADDAFTAERFRKAYAIKLRANAITQVDTALGLSITDKKLLGTGL